MSHYEERLQQDLDRIRDMVRSLGKDVEDSLESAVRALLTFDRDMASETILRDHHINRLSRRLDASCHAFVARHLPSAGHLRFISSVLRLSVALERIGDYAVTLCRETVQLTQRAPDDVARDLEILADRARSMYRQAVSAFLEGNAELARGTKALSADMASTTAKVYDDLVRAAEKDERPVRDCFALLAAFNRLERIQDQSKNICEETIFTVTGETKQPKTYRVLFVDETNDGASQMAELIARKAFPQSGRYASAGWSPADGLQPALREFMDQRGFDVQQAAPKKIVGVHDELDQYHVVVDLQGDARDRVEELPFHTVLLRWDLGDGRDGSDEAGLERLYGTLSPLIRDLMEQMRGAEAS